jgi:hypothetical protein
MSNTFQPLIHFTSDVGSVSIAIERSVSAHYSYPAYCPQIDRTRAQGGVRKATSGLRFSSES